MFVKKKQKAPKLRIRSLGGGDVAFDLLSHPTLVFRGISGVCTKPNCPPNDFTVIKDGLNISATVWPTFWAARFHIGEAWVKREHPKTHTLPLFLSERPSSKPFFGQAYCTHDPLRDLSSARWSKPGFRRTNCLIFHQLEESWVGWGEVRTPTRANPGAPLGFLRHPNLPVTGAPAAVRLGMREQSNSDRRSRPRLQSRGYRRPGASHALWIRARCPRRATARSDARRGSVPRQHGPRPRRHGGRPLPNGSGPPSDARHARRR